MSKEMTNIKSYIIILFIAFVGITAIIYTGNEAAANENSNLDNDSIEYIANLQGIELPDTNISSSDIEMSALFNTNTSQGNPKDEGLDFLFAKEKGLSLETAAKAIFLLPGFLIQDLLRLPYQSWEWVVHLLNWMWWLLLIVAVVYFARGIIDK